MSVLLLPFAITRIGFVLLQVCRRLRLFARESSLRDVQDEEERDRGKELIEAHELIRRRPSKRVREIKIHYHRYQ